MLIALGFFFFGLMSGFSMSRIGNPGQSSCDNIQKIARSRSDDSKANLINIMAEIKEIKNRKSHTDRFDSMSKVIQSDKDDGNNNNNNNMNLENEATIKKLQEASEFHIPFPTQENQAAYNCALSKSCSCETQYSQTFSNMMLSDETKLLLKYVQGKKTYFEWGSGGSTDFFPRFLGKNSFAVSIENYMPWCAKLKETPYIQCKIAKQELSYNCHDPGVSQSAGANTVRLEDIGTYTLYIDAIKGTWWRGIESGKRKVTKNKDEMFDKFDVVLVDGRARVACALNAFDCVSKDGVVVVHDWQRYRNSTLLKYYDIVEESKPRVVGETQGRAIPGMAVLKRKSSMSKVTHEDMMEARHSKA